MATRKHSLLAANRKNMGLIEDAYNQTQAFNDPVVQRRKMFGHMADTGKTIFGGYNKLKDAAQDYYTGELQKNPPKRPEIEGEIISEDDDLVDDLVIEEEPFNPNMKEFEPPADNEEYLRSLSVGENPDAKNIVTGSQGSGPTSYASTRNTEDLIYQPTENDIDAIVSFAVDGPPTPEQIASDPRKYYNTQFDSRPTLYEGLFNFGASKYNPFRPAKYGRFMDIGGKK